MAASFNQAIVVGNLGRDPEVKYTQNGTAVVTLSVATTERFKDSEGQWQERPEWHQVVVWGAQAERCTKHLAKGDRALFEGRLQTRSYQVNGQERKVTEIVARTVQFLGGRKGGPEVSAGQDEQEEDAPQDLEGV